MQVGSFRHQLTVFGIVLRIMSYSFLEQNVRISSSFVDKEIA